MFDTPQIAQTTGQITAFIRLTVTPDEMKKEFGPTIWELIGGVQAQGIQPAGPVFAHHLRGPTDTFDFKLSIPVSAPVVAAGRIQPGTWPAMKVARTIHHGAYEGLHESWGGLMEWIEANGLNPATGFYESYVIHPDANPDPTAWRTELSRPLL
jgi:effector-binding domain-containing protein